MSQHRLRRSASTPAAVAQPLLEFLAPSLHVELHRSIRDFQSAAVAAAQEHEAPAQKKPSSRRRGPLGSETAQAPRRKPLSSQPRSSSAAASPIDVLSQIRSAAPVEASAGGAKPSSSSFAYLAHNSAIQNIIAGTSKGTTSFKQAFVNGWLPIQAAGNAARAQPQDLGRVLELTSIALKTREGANEHWPSVKELALWLVAEDNAPGLTRWCWRELQAGAAGAERVVEFWEAFERGEHLAIRSGPGALDRAFKSIRKLPPPAARAPAAVFAAYIAARSMVASASPEPSSFASALPSLLKPSSPSLKKLLERADFPPMLESISASNSPALKDAAERAHAWIRQTYLAQTWYSSGRTPGFEIVRTVRIHFRTSGQAIAWQMWELIREGVESDEVKWIDESKWHESGSDRWLAKSEQEEQELDDALRTKARDVTEQRPSSDDVSSTDVADSTSSNAARFDLAPAYLTQALLAPFIGGFARASLYTQATEIWSWLQSRSLEPGVVTWTALLHGYAIRGDVDATEAAYGEMVKAGVEPDVWAWMERIGAHFEAKRPDDAMDLAQQMSSDNTLRLNLPEGKLPPVVYGRLVLGLLSNKRLSEAEEILKQMTDDGGPVTIHTINNFLDFHTRSKKPDLASVVRCLRLVSEHNLEPDVYTFTLVLQALLSTGQRDATSKLVKIMEATGVRPTPTTYGAIIHHLASSGQPDELRTAVELIEEMENKKVVTNEIIYTSVIQAFLRAIAHTPTTGLEQGEQHPYMTAALALKDRMHSRGIHFNRVGYNAIIAAALSLQTEWGTSLALRTFREMQQRSKQLGQTGDGEYEVDSGGKGVTSADTWAVLLNGFAKMGDWSRARALVGEMDRTGFKVQGKALARIVDKVQRGGYPG